MADVKRKDRIGIGLIGSGFMGRCHANAFAAAPVLFDLPAMPVRAILADATEEAAEAGARALGFERATADWEALISDDAVDIIAITAPNVLHEPMAMAAIAARKTVYCEKPLSITAASARRMTEAAEAAGVVTSVGFNFLRNPMIRLAKDIITSGEIGEITGFRGRHAENYMASPDAPHSFRTDPLGGGAVADIGSHIISIARYLLGPIAEVSADCRTIYPDRPVSHRSAERRAVEVDDMTHALVRFASGVSGSLEANWAATGRTMDLSFEISGSKGAVAFSQEHMNELLVFSGSGASAGYKRIEAGPLHTPYDRFCPAPGHHLGFNDLKVIEVADLIESHVSNGQCMPDFREALAVQETVEAIQEASKARTWVRFSTSRSM
ncbi:1-carboxy-3-chloro-3,4-dihydroxycyclo hexa-1,5-diene dehydrogenase [Roseivivax halodurans JCM 10272]|uniref:1-carboxy-3-chloro-3,4-dihydroxycyclo hexa-1,5-diene dehydrogenase n=1 Tax=Roseivivax halodurans JCM 10272 TaxID=1449350 RepID=X7EDI6_9RHOB|nr:Gfo/Idh/MocA family oxidoreductase [Roseivivax halodurans]ETX13910.1 1-carboxy-3-chloro-3,4-dihydroxycyclo hexa-1,5-diene dehydrogenase [Roseivivax halodurans JCM 10272]